MAIFNSYVKLPEGTCHLKRMTQRRDLLQRFPGQLRLPEEQRNGLGRFLRGTSFRVPGSDGIDFLRKKRWDFDEKPMIFPGFSYSFC